MGHARITVAKGTGWRKYIREMPHAQMRPIGTVKFGATLEGALVLDLNSGLYLLIDNTNAWYGLDQAQVVAALGDIQ